MVQVLKEEIRTAILGAAEEEFMVHGYLSASVKRIAAKVGIAVGNLYRYYEGKESLFDSIVAPVYVDLDNIIAHHREQAGEEDFIDLAIHVLMDHLWEHRRPLLILIHGSKGTNHEDATRKFYKMMADHIVEHLTVYNQTAGSEAFSEEASWPISVAFMQGYFDIIRRYDDAENCRRMLYQYVNFWYVGLKAFI